MDLLLAHNAWQIDRPSYVSMLNSYSFQSVGHWMGYSFTNLGAEGCCLSQSTLLSLSFDRKVMGYYRMVDADVLDPTNEYHTRPLTVTMLTSITDPR